MRYTTMLIALFLGLTTVAQQQSSEPTASAADKKSATIYVFARNEAPSRSWYPVYCDNSLAAELKRGKFFAIKVEPGRHMISGEDGIPTFIDARSGEEYFVRLERSLAVGPSGKYDVTDAKTVRPDDARKELNYLTYIDVSKIHSESVLKPDPIVVSEPALKKRPVER